tara:strand:- start:1636 stop:2436 length:801 start_codon:yes stop_codon:yes gene_type:complete
MKNLLTLKDLQLKYKPDILLNKIEENYLKHRVLLLNLLSIDSCPLSKYTEDRQMSFLNSDKVDNNSLIKDVINSLHDAIFFMTLSKKERTVVTKKMRLFANELIDNQLARIEIFLEDPILTMPFANAKEVSSPDDINKLVKTLKLITFSLKSEKSYWRSMPRAGYLSGLQVSMGEFFFLLQKIGMSQKDQITLVEQIFEEFKVDWKEGARENIKISLQQPALEIFDKRNNDFKKVFDSDQIMGVEKNIISELTSFFSKYQTQLRRF